MSTIVCQCTSERNPMSTDTCPQSKHGSRPPSYLLHGLAKACGTCLYLSSSPHPPPTNPGLHNLNPHSCRSWCGLGEAIYPTFLVAHGLSDTLQEVSALKLEAFSTPSPPLPGPGFHGRRVWLILALCVVESSSFLLAHSKAVVLGWEALPPRGQLWYQDCGAEAALGMLADALRCPGKLFLLPLITTWP